ncbi:unnamed protein product [Camellia sinensis]
MDCQSHGNSEFTDLPYSERALILSVYADGLSSHVTWCTVTWHLPKAVHNQLYKQLKGVGVAEGDSSRRGGGRGSDDAEDETPFALLDASCAYHDRFGKRHFVMPKYYRDPCGLVEDPSDNQTGYARSVEIQKEDPDNLHIVKKDAQKNRTEPNVAAIKGIMEDPELVSDAELSDCSDSEPPADLSAN